MNNQTHRYSDIDHEGFCFVKVMRRRAKWAIGFVIFLILCAGAWYCAELTIEDIEAKDSYVFARQRIGKMRAERELVHEQEVVFIESPEWKSAEIFHDELLSEYEELKSKFSEPNEPEWHQVQAMIHKDVPPGVYAIWVSPGTEKLFDITSLIPTWPGYIELEKDLVCFPPDDNDVCTVGDGIEWLLLTKGTKIYFKE